MKYGRQFDRGFERVFQEGCEKCQIMHTYYGYYYVRNSDFPRENWTFSNAESAYSFCHRLSKRSERAQAPNQPQPPA